MKDNFIVLFKEVEGEIFFKIILLDRNCIISFFGDNLVRKNKRCSNVIRHKFFNPKTISLYFNKDIFPGAKALKITKKDLTVWLGKVSIDQVWNLNHFKFFKTIYEEN